MYYKILIIVILFNSCTKSNDDKQKEYTSANQLQSKPIVNQDIDANEDCVDYVALWSASDISEELGIEKKWVFLNYTVDIWDIPPSNPNPGNIVCELRASSYARIIDRTDNEYLVESPMTKAHGWLDKSHVKSITKKNIKTLALCN